jgi:hypothetical protein
MYARRNRSGSSRRGSVVAFENHRSLRDTELRETGNSPRISAGLIVEDSDCDSVSHFIEIDARNAVAYAQDTVNDGVAPVRKLLKCVLCLPRDDSCALILLWKTNVATRDSSRCCKRRVAQARAVHSLHDEIALGIEEKSSGAGLVICEHNKWIFTWSPNT